MCVCMYKTTEHYCFHCNKYALERDRLFQSTRDLHPLNCHLLLFGNLNYSQEDNITIVNSVHKYKLDSNRFKLHNYNSVLEYRLTQQENTFFCRLLLFFISNIYIVKVWHCPMSLSLFLSLSLSLSFSLSLSLLISLSIFISLYPFSIFLDYSLMHIPTI